MHLIEAFFVYSSNNSTASKVHLKQPMKEKNALCLLFSCLWRTDDKWWRDELGTFTNFHCLCREFQFKKERMGRVTYFHLMQTPIFITKCTLVPISGNEVIKWRCLSKEIFNVVWALCKKTLLTSMSSSGSTPSFSFEDILWKSRCVLACCETWTVASATKTCLWTAWLSILS